MTMTLPLHAHPIDLDHLGRQTFHDKVLQREVLMLFGSQLDEAVETLPATEHGERWQVAHGLKGAAAGVGAFEVAACAERILRQPQDDELIGQLRAAAEDVRAFLLTLPG